MFLELSRLSPGSEFYHHCVGDRLPCQVPREPHMDPENVFPTYCPFVYLVACCISQPCHQLYTLAPYVLCRTVFSVYLELVLCCFWPPVLHHSLCSQRRSFFSLDLLHLYPYHKHP